MGHEVKVSAAPAGDGWACSVEVAHGGSRTEHQVSVSRADVERWGRGRRLEDVEELVARSFRFLLEREPPEAILKRFELSVIPGYFPEFSRVITK